MISAFDGDVLLYVSLEILNSCIGMHAQWDIVDKVMMVTDNDSFHTECGPY